MTNNKLTDLLKKNYHYLILAIFFVTALYINFHVTLQGDDYIYRQAAVCSFPQILQFLKWHYAEYNGRTLVHLLDILALKIPYGDLIWKFVCSALLCVYCVVVSKMCNGKSDDNFKSGIVLAAASVVTVNPCFWNESLYWITGSFNYFFPNLLFLVLILVFRKNSKSKWLLPLTVICAFSVEQVCMMTLGFWVLMMTDRLCREKKFSLLYFVRVIISILGIVSIVFLSKSGKRMNELNSGNSSFIMTFAGNIFNYLKSIWFGNVNVALLIIITLIVSSIWISRLSRNKLILIPVWILTVFNYLLKAFSILTNITLSNTVNVICTAMFICFAVMYCITVLTAGILIYKCEKEWLPVTAVILAFGAQLMLGVENYLIYRTCMPTIFMLSVYDIYSVLRFKIKPKIFKPAVCGACIAACLVHGYIAPNTLITQKKIDVKPLTDSQLEEFESYTAKYGSAFIYAEKDEFVEPEKDYQFSWTTDSLIDFSNY